MVSNWIVNKQQILCRELLINSCSIYRPPVYQKRCMHIQILAFFYISGNGCFKHREFSSLPMTFLSHRVHYKKNPCLSRQGFTYKSQTIILSSYFYFWCSSQNFFVGSRSVLTEVFNKLFCKVLGLFVVCVFIRPAVAWIH